jgi:hypothetical protein
MILSIVLTLFMFVTSPGMERIKKDSSLGEIRKMYLGKSITFDSTMQRWVIHQVAGYGRSGRIEIDTSGLRGNQIRWVDETPIGTYDTYEKYDQSLLENLYLSYGPSDVIGVHAWTSDSGTVAYFSTYGLPARIWWKPGKRSTKTLEETIELIFGPIEY